MDSNKYVGRKGRGWGLKKKIEICNFNHFIIYRCVVIVQQYQHAIITKKRLPNYQFYLYNSQIHFHIFTIHLFFTELCYMTSY